MTTFYARETAGAKTWYAGLHAALVSVTLPSAAAGSSASPAYLQVLELAGRFYQLRQRRKVWQRLVVQMACACTQQ